MTFAGVLFSAEERVNRKTFLFAFVLSLFAIFPGLIVFGIRNYLSYAVGSYMLAIVGTKRMRDIGLPASAMIAVLCPAAGPIAFDVLGTTSPLKYQLADMSFLALFSWIALGCTLPPQLLCRHATFAPLGFERVRRSSFWASVALTTVLITSVLHYTGIVVALTINPGLLFGDA